MNLLSSTSESNTLALPGVACTSGHTDLTTHRPLPEVELHPVDYKNFRRLFDALSSINNVTLAV